MQGTTTILDEENIVAINNTSVYCLVYYDLYLTKSNTDSNLLSDTDGELVFAEVILQSGGKQLGETAIQ